MNAPARAFSPWKRERSFEGKLPLHMLSGTPLQAHVRSRLISQPRVTRVDDVVPARAVEKTPACQQIQGASKTALA